MNVQVALKTHYYELDYFSDPLPPTELRESASTTTSVTVQWAYDATASFVVKWQVTYTAIGSDDVSGFIIEKASTREVNVSSLTPGQTYVVSVFAVTGGNVRSETAAHVNVTAGTNVSANKVPLYVKRTTYWKLEE